MFGFSGDQLKRLGNGPALHVFNVRDEARAFRPRREPSLELSFRQHISAKTVRNIAAASPGFGQTNPGNAN